MSNDKKEYRNNFAVFCTGWHTERGSVEALLSSHKAILEDSYLEIISLQAWRSELLEDILPPPVTDFYNECHNDALMSHVCASSGQWRLALKSLRSSIENVFATIYFKDHLIELEKWESGSFKIGFTELSRYVGSHPALASFSESQIQLDTLVNEYATLSRAVHSSARIFRMRKNESINIFDPDLAAFSKWRSREHTVIKSINRLLSALFREHLQKAHRRNLRKAIGLKLSANEKKIYKDVFDITIP